MLLPDRSQIPLGGLLSVVPISSERGVEVPCPVIRHPPIRATVPTTLASTSAPYWLTPPSPCRAYCQEEVALPVIRVGPECLRSAGCSLTLGWHLPEQDVPDLTQGYELEMDQGVCLDGASMGPR